MREFCIHSEGIEATIVPERGGLITQLAIDGIELLFLDRITFEDRSAHVRGGIPILFPFAARLDDGILKATSAQMPLHGFARDLEWTTDEDAAKESPDSHRMWLESDEETLEPYPFPLRLVQTTRVIPGQLSVSLDIENKGDQPMPMAPGWHPYFRCPAEGKIAVTYEIDDFPYDELSAGETYDIGLQAPRASEICFEIPTVTRVRLAFSPEFRHLQFWSLPEREFICVEPWDGPANVINTEECRFVEPGEAATYWMGISLAGKKVD